MIKEQPLNTEQVNEFTLNRLGYYCKVKTVWDSVRKKNSFKFDIIQYEDCQEVIIQKGTKAFPLTEHEAIRKRDEIISFYLKKVEK
jgi:hypothetical protein